MHAGQSLIFAARRSSKASLSPRRWPDWRGRSHQTTVDSVHVDGLALRIESELFRIAQEALTNVRKHAHAHTVQIGLRRRGASLSLSVRDDGRGFVVAEARRGDGQGVIGMRERARLLGGRLQISSTPGSGTRVTARVPLEHESA